MFVELLTVEQKTCRDSFDNIRKNDESLPNVTDNMFCAGTMGGGNDSCLGDSGSALVIPESYVFFAKGIVSWGMRECGKSGTYGVYTQVSRYLDWISKTMSDNEWVLSTSLSVMVMWLTIILFVLIICHVMKC